jgi:hypothetical protein
VQRGKGAKENNLTQRRREAETRRREDKEREGRREGETEKGK